MQTMCNKQGGEGVGWLRAAATSLVPNVGEPKLVSLAANISGKTLSVGRPPGLYVRCATEVEAVVTNRY
jgi:hypothetical protein